MIKQTLKHIILFLIQLIEYFEYRNTNLDKKILNSIELDNFQVETDTGFKEASHIHITKPFYIYDLELEDDLKLSAADEHILFDKNMNQVFIKDLKTGDLIQTKHGLKQVYKVKHRKQKVSMFDMTINDDNHRFYTNDILSHNTILSCIIIAWFFQFQVDKNVFLVANIEKTSKEIMNKIKIIIENLPFFLKPGILKNDVMEMKNDNGNRIVTGSTTKRSGISFSIDILYLDEFAHVADNIQKEFYYNIFPTISASKTSKMIITSTPNGYNLFYDLFSDAQKDLNALIPHEVNWWQVPGRDAEWRDEQIGLLGSEEAFNIQYGASFITADGRLLSSAHIERLEKITTNYKLVEFEELIDLDLNYEKYFTFKDGYDLERLYDNENFFVFSIDIAEGGGGTSDFSVLNLFEIDIIDKEFFETISAPSSFQDFFGLKQIAKFSTNELSIEDFVKISYVILFDIFNSENLKLILEMNTYGGEFLKTIQNIFPGSNEFDDEIVVKFKHKIDSKVSKMGLKIKTDNKPIMAQKFKKYFHVGRVEITEKDTIAECISFGKDKHGRYKGLMGHDDLVMTCINVCEFLTTMDFMDFCEEKFEVISVDIKNKINKVLELAETDGNSLQYDLYSILGNSNNYNRNTELDIF